MTQINSLFLTSRGDATGSQPIRYFDSVRGFVSGGGLNAAFDLPWAPIYIFVIFLLHPLLGAFAAACAVVLISAALLNQRLTHGPLSEANDAAAANYRFTEMSLRNWEVVQTMGMLPGLLRRWTQDRDRLMERQTAAAERSAITSSLIRFLRLAMQSLVLGLGAWLVIEREASIGVMFAAAILLARALQPVEQIVGSWRNISGALTAYGRVKDILGANALPVERLSFAKAAGPTGRSGGGLRHAWRQQADARRHQLCNRARRGGRRHRSIGRRQVHAGPPPRRHPRADLWGGAVGRGRHCEWPRDTLGRYIGYLPQDIELFADTVANNICRFEDGDSAEVIEAAQMAGVHEAILALPDGYDTQVGLGGAVLSGGMRQRIGLARAIYGSPCLVVLDEPNSNLDVDGETALAACISQLKARGTTVIVVSHRAGTLGVVDKVLAMKEGTAIAFGPRNDIVPRLARPVPVQAMSNSAGQPSAGADQSIDRTEQTHETAAQAV